MRKATLNVLWDLFDTVTSPVNKIVKALRGIDPRVSLVSAIIGAILCLRFGMTLDIKSITVMVLFLCVSIIGSILLAGRVIIPVYHILKSSRNEYLDRIKNSDE